MGSRRNQQRKRAKARLRGDHPISEGTRERFLERVEPEAFRKPEPVKPLTARQAEFLSLLETEEMVLALGPAGTGKTYIAAAVAADLLLEGEVDKIILTRPAVGADEEHGFLPGGIEQKLAPWVVPFTDVISKRLGKAKFESAVRAGRIEVAPFAYMRGRTFSDAFVILDEAQNTTPAQIKMFLTRIGEGSVTVVNGDVRQTDLRAESGLALVLRMVAEQRLDVPVVEFTKADVVRSGVCAMWAEAFEKLEDAA